MKIVETIDELEFTKDSIPWTNLIQFQLQEIPLAVITSVMSRLHQGQSIIIYSGGWRLNNLHGYFIEPTYFKNTEISFPSNTHFLDDGVMIQKISRKFTNILFVDSLLTRYKTLQEINDLMLFYPNSIFAVNIIFLIYNRLKMTKQELAKKLNGECIENFIVISNQCP